MALEVFWTEEAEEQLDEIIEYLKEHWTEKEISKFFKRLEEGLTEIKNAPHRYKDSIRKLDCKEFNLSPQTTIFYSYNSQVLNFLLLWTNKKNPKSLGGKIA